MTDEEKINEARGIFKASKQAYLSSIDEKLNEIVEMIQGSKACEDFWLGSPPPDLQSLVNTIRLYRPAQPTMANNPAMVYPAPESRS